MASFSFIFPEDRHCSIKDNDVNSGWMSMVTQLNALGGPESESQKFRQSFAEELGDKYHYANAIDSSLLWNVGYTPYIPQALKGRSFPSVESFFLDEWEPLTLLQTPQVLSTSVSIEEDNLIQSDTGLVSQVLSTSVAIVENDLIQSAAGLVSQVLSTSVSIEEDNLIQSAAVLVSQVLSTSVSIEEDHLIQYDGSLVSQVLSTSVAIVENDLIQSTAVLVSQVLSTSVAIVENDLIQSAAVLVSQVLSTSVAIVENDLIQSAAVLVSQVLSTSVAIVENDLIQSATNLMSQHNDSTLRDSNQPEIHVAEVSTKRSRLVITISMFSTKSCLVALHEVDASATSLEQSAEKMSTSTTDVNNISTAAAKKKRCGLFSSLWRALRGKNKKPVKVASKKEDEINKDVSSLTHHNTTQGDH
ncbi:uncharacterized protein isoform X2 [Salmo salar]|uniref:Uncharacterized protein isoform X2 n=1 Tax=Salmo salar TaxID=8030 RepID=A0A1S3PPE1_SALSA|nr:uncharacterized protein LOC106586580 isoform X2 [Salmo salar]|eukprot:XP_014029501.1 PREDICTED: uncharacterized protein LOC106586580 isoform X2 [Salmo salar]